MSAELNSVQEIRVQCVEHAIGFSVPRLTRRIVCEQGNHELDPDFPHYTFWDYCCDCEIFRPSDAFQNKQAESVCPLCVSATTANLTALNALRREIGRRFLCSLCNCMTVESNEGSSSELFTLVTNGAPASCPGCLNPVSNSLFKHDCDSPLMPVSYMTVRQKCPFCNRPITQSTKGLETSLPCADVPLVLDRVTEISEVSESDKGSTFTVSEWSSRPEAISSHLGLIVGVVSVLITLMILLVPPILAFGSRRWHKFRNHVPMVEPIECANRIVEGDPVLLKAHAQDPDKDHLNFVWSTFPAGIGRIEKSNEDGSRATFFSENVPPGHLVIELTVSDEDESAPVQKTDIYVSARLNHPPDFKYLTCNCANSEVRAGESVSLEGFAEDNDPGDILTYEWSSSIPSVRISEVKLAHGSRAVIDTSGLSPQSSAEPVTIFLKISDGHGSPLLTNVILNVLPRQVAGKSGDAAPLQQQANHAPRFEKFSVSKNSVDEGENVELRAEVIDPDGNWPLYYYWTSTAGGIQSYRGTATLNTTGVSASEVEVTLMVANGVGGRASLRTTITVRPRANKSPSSSPSPSTTREGAPSPKT